MGVIICNDSIKYSIYKCLYIESYKSGIVLHPCTIASWTVRATEMVIAYSCFLIGNIGYEHRMNMDWLIASGIAS